MSINLKDAGRLCRVSDAWNLPASGLGAVVSIQGNDDRGVWHHLSNCRGWLRFAGSRSLSDVAFTSLFIGFNCPVLSGKCDEIRVLHVRLSAAWMSFAWEFFQFSLGLHVDCVRYLLCAWRLWEQKNTVSLIAFRYFLSVCCLVVVFSISSEDPNTNIISLQAVYADIS